MWLHINLIKVTVWLFCILALFMITGTIFLPDYMQVIIFSSWLFICLLTFLVIALLICSWKQGLSWCKFGYQLCHLGVVLILTGAFWGYIMAKDTQFYAPIGSQYKFSKLPKADKSYIELGFAFNIDDFKVEYYEPEYALYKPVKKTDGKSDDFDYEYVGRVKISPDGFYDVGEVGKINATSLKEKIGNQWVTQYSLDNGWILKKSHAVDRHYRVEMNIFDDDVQKKVFTVNHPVNYKGWRFFIMSYDREVNSYVVLKARNDPGRIPVIVGIWLLIIGAAVLGFRKQKGESVNQGKIRGLSYAEN